MLLWTKVTTLRVISPLIFSISLGILSGILSSAFLYTLYYVTNLRESNSYFLFLLPLFAIAQYYINSKNSNIDKGMITILKSLNDKSRVRLSWLLTPYIFLTSIGTHLFGGSAGREGVGVLMGTSIANGLEKILKSNVLYERLILYCGIAAGFSSIFGTPLAAIVFPFELCRYFGLKDKSLLAAVTLSSFIAYYTTVLLGLKHSYQTINIEYSSSLFTIILISGFLCALGARLFIITQKKISHYFYHPKGILALSIILVAFILYFSLYEYSGIGVTFIEKTFTSQRSFGDFFIKLFFTAITLGIGLKGGEVTPLFFMGSSLINASAGALGLGLVKLSSAVGMFSFFAAATLTPLTSTLMAYEYYGIKIALVTLPAAFIAKLLMSGKSIYK